MNEKHKAAAGREAQALGCMLENNNCIMIALAAGLKADDFSVKLHGHIYQAIIDMNENEGSLIDVLTVIARLKDKKQLEAGEDAYIAGLVDAYATTAAAGQYINIIQRYAAERHIEELKQKLAKESDYNKIPQIIRELGAQVERLQVLTDQTDSRPNGVYDYIEKSFNNDIMGFAAGASRRTGFDNFDTKAGGLYAGLYVVGGSSSLGKTTLVHQLADQLAERGSHVLYFSLEMGKLELVSKSIARTAAKTGTAQRMTSLQIRKGMNADLVRESGMKYAKAVQNRMNIIEGNFDCTVSKIETYARNYISRTGEKPVIVIDYLQIIQADADPKTNRKPTETRQATDQNVTALKRLSRSLNVPVIVVSSLNRGSYLSPISFESFKESGGIEYTADVVLGLNLQVVHAIADDKNDTKKREALQQAKEANPRKIELVCIKNRYGRDFRIDFDYYADRDTFRESVPVTSVRR